MLLVSCCFLLSACSFPGSVKPAVKIGLSAPFEGLYRDLGYEVLHAVRLAVRQRNGTGGVGDRYFVELVALNDFNEAEEAAWQARELAVDPGVLAALGGWSAETARAATPEYRRLGLPFLAPETDWSAGYHSAGRPEPEAAGRDEAFVMAYQALSGGAPPGPAAVWAYAATNRLLDAMEEAISTGQPPSRAAVRAALGSTSEG